MSHTLVFDFGTSYLKAAVVDVQEQMVATCQIAVSADRSQGYSQWTVEKFQQTVRQALAQLGSTVSQVTTICFSSQANSFVLLDEHDQCLTPFVLWDDCRASTMDHAELAQVVVGHRYSNGVPKFSFQMMPAKARWFAQHEPELWQRTVRIAFLSDYFTWWLTGQWVAEAGIAGLTGLLDIRTLQWIDEPCHAAGLKPQMLSRPVRAGTDLGEVKAETATALGLPTGCRFVVGCLDQYAGAVGMAGLNERAITETTGTVLAVVRYVSEWTGEGGETVCVGPAAMSGGFFQMCFGSTSANLLEYYRSTLVPPPSFETLDELAAEASDWPIIEPVEKTGSVAASVDPHIGSWTLGQMTRGIYEAVALALMQQVKSLCGQMPVEQVVAGGGGSNSGLWLAIKSDRLMTPVVAATTSQAAIRGAARLAMA